jgi:hypothetical protein
MSSLFELTAECLSLYELADEDEKVFADTLEGLKGEIGQKAANYVDLIDQLEMESAACEKKYKLLKARADSRANAAKRLKSALLGAMQAMDVKEMDAGDYKLKISKNGGLQPLVIDGEVPESMTKVTIEPDNTKIREYLKDHEADWAHLAERGVHLTIK